MAKRTLVRKTSDVSLTALRFQDKQGPRRDDKPTELDLADIQVADQVFQWRLQDEDLLADERFVHELVDALDVQEEPPAPLAKLLVTPVGQQFYLVDGHHRLDAYLTFGWTGPVPVEVFEKDLEAATMEAWKRNAHNKLPMTTASRFEAAWRLVKDGALSRAAITQLTSVKRSTLTKMRTLLTTFGEQARVLPWKDALRLRRDDVVIDEGWKDKAARDIALHLAKGPKNITDPELLALGLEKAKPDLPSSLVGQWPREVREWLVGRAEEECPALVEDIERVFRTLCPALDDGETLGSLRDL